MITLITYYPCLETNINADIMESEIIIMDQAAQASTQPVLAVLIAAIVGFLIIFGACLLPDMLPVKILGEM